MRQNIHMQQNIRKSLTPTTNIVLSSMQLQQ